MTKLMQDAIDTLHALPPEHGDAIARVVLRLAARDRTPYSLTPDEEADILASEAAADRGEFASEEEVRAIWAKHGL